MAFNKDGALLRHFRDRWRDDALGTVREMVAARREQLDTGLSQFFNELGDLEKLEFLYASLADPQSSIESQVTDLKARLLVIAHRRQRGEQFLALHWLDFELVDRKR